VSDYLFVYGTLMRRCGLSMHRYLEAHAEFVTEASLWGELFRVSDYPGVVLGGARSSQVQGEVYRVLDPAALFRILDDYEECASHHPEPHEYRRALCPVRWANGHQGEAWVYLYQGETWNLARIPDGRFC
jgi:gamma-glutamylcyclotransferase (GGCT)/AIG2-like uncharacterized protein YtfP